uniref:Alpha-L-rhamnosidase six-hairpin glycosidase domain-containing protein n=1 Tax=Bionectria ochroleuca TaxID=29856 RepID=A0A8H7NIQ1_BIOOC
MRYLRLLLLTPSLFALTAQAQDDIGFKNGVVELNTANFDVKLIKDSGTLASLRPAGSDFDFLPYDYLLLDRRVQNGSYHWGDITLRYRERCGGNWSDGDSAAQRTPVTWLEDGVALAATNLSPTMQTGPLNITREWIDVEGDLGLQFTIANTGRSNVELGSLGFPASVNNIFTSRKREDMYANCSFMDPYIGLDAGYLQITPIKGTGAALVVTPIGDTPLEAYRFLPEESRGGTRIESNGWEGYYEWQVHSKAWAANEWKDAQPWNHPTSAVIRPGAELKYGVRFTLVKEGVREIDRALRNLEMPTAVAVPGYILPRDIIGRLNLQYSSKVSSIGVEPAGALVVTGQDENNFSVKPTDSAWGRVLVTVTYEDQKVQTIHYYVTKSASEAISDLGRFVTSEQWFDDESDPFGRGPSPMGYDHDTKTIVTQDQRVWVAGLSDEGGAGAYVAAVVKQAFLPDAKEVAKLDSFVEKVLSKAIQDEEHGVKLSVFFYEPEVVPGYNYSTSIDWKKGTFNKAKAYQVTRAYNYVWPAASYWALYRVARAYPTAVEHEWEWYLDRAFKTVMRGMGADVGYNDAGLMGETVFGEILDDLEREGKRAEAGQLEQAMRARVSEWVTQEYPFGSEMSWDSTGQEGVYYWCRRFGETTMQHKTKDTILGYMPTIPHWGYNGNARRYWDFGVTGKLQTIERQIHHYGSALNALALLSSFKDDPSDSYLIRVGYAGTMAPLSNIHEDGFASCAMHARPEHLSWDGFSGDYGPGFVGMALGSGTYLIDDDKLGLVSYGGVLEVNGRTASVQVRDAMRQKIFIGPLGLEVKIDAGIIQSFTYNLDSGAVSIRLGQRPGSLKAEMILLWSNRIVNGSRVEEVLFDVAVDGAEVKDERMGKLVPMVADEVTIHIN